MRGLYIHLPFCIKKCHYCNFVITTKTAKASRQEFFSALEKEIQAAAQQYGRLHFDTLYLGGGTPSVIEVSEMERLLKVLRSTFSFTEGHELTCEVNPGEISREKLQAFFDLGINRISLGAQAFQDHHLEAMGRMHKANAIIQTMRWLHEIGFKNISLDLILRLPDQSLKEFKISLQEGIKLGPVQFSLYDLEVHQKTVFGRRARKGELRFVNEAEHAEMFQAADEILQAHGFLPYEVSTFAKPGFESRHNLIYWHNQEYLGLGPGAFSYLNGCRYQFAPDVNRYLEKCRHADWQPDTLDHIEAEKKEIETLLTGLRLREGIDLSCLALIRPRIVPQIDLLVAEKLLQRQGERVSLTLRGRAIVENVFELLV